MSQDTFEKHDISILLKEDGTGEIWIDDKRLKSCARIEIDLPANHEKIVRFSIFANDLEVKNDEP